jgi:hypothetical protein
LIATYTNVTFLPEKLKFMIGNFIYFNDPFTPRESEVYWREMGAGMTVGVERRHYLLRIRFSYALREVDRYL